MTATAPDVELVGFDLFAQIPEPLLYDPKISDLAVRVFGVLHRYGRTPERCFPSHEAIGQKIGKSARTVQRAQGELQEAGWVEVVARYRGDGGRTSNGYRLHAEPVTPVTPPSDTGVAGPSDMRFPGATSGASEEREQLNESQMNETPLPPASGGSGDGNLVLFGADGSASDVPTRAERTRPADAGLAASFDLWWQGYPRGRNGGKTNARKAWLRRCRAGEVTPAQLDEALTRYAQARRLFAEHWQVDLDAVPLMHGSTFVNGRWDEWSEPMMPSAVPNLWRRPEGARRPLTELDQKRVELAFRHLAEPDPDHELPTVEERVAKLLGEGVAEDDARWLAETMAAEAAAERRGELTA